MKKTSECPEPCLTKAQRLERLRWTRGTGFNVVQRFHSYKNEWYKVFNSPGIVETTDERLASWVIGSTPTDLWRPIADAIEDGYPADPMVWNFIVMFIFSLFHLYNFLIHMICYMLHRAVIGKVGVCKLPTLPTLLFA